MKNQKGITLIALVITIIVLLILAGVSIAMLAGENGILTQANSAKTETNKAEAKEKISLALNAVKAKVYECEVSNSAYDPFKNGESVGLNSNIVTVLGYDNIITTTDSVTGNDSDDGQYIYTPDTTNKVLTITYYNTGTNVGLVEEGEVTKHIIGSINLDIEDEDDYLKIENVVEQDVE